MLSLFLLVSDSHEKCGNQLGKEFFKRRWRQRGPSGLVFVVTLDAESLETLVDSYLALAKQLGITEYALTNLAIAKSERPKETLQHLKLFVMSKTRTFNDWLIIVDNVVDLSLIHGYVPENGNREWGNGVGHDSRHQFLSFQWSVYLPRVIKRGNAAK